MGTVVFTSPRTLRVLGPLQKLLLPLIFGSSNIPDKNSKIGRKFYYLEKLNSKIGRKTYYLEKLNSKNGRKFYYSQKLCFDKFFEWKEYNFLSGFLTNTILNFCQEWQLLWAIFSRSILVIPVRTMKRQDDY